VAASRVGLCFSNKEAAWFIYIPQLKSGAKIGARRHLSFTIYHLE